MTAERRLDALESSLTATQRVIAWLEEAHAFGDFETYTRALLDEPPGAFPINRLLREAVTAARAATRGKPAEEVNRTVRREARETVFRYELVIHLNVTAHETVDRQALVYVALVGMVNALMIRHQYVPKSVPNCLAQLANCRDLQARQVDEMLAHEAAQTQVEERYLDGYAALFPGLAAKWRDQLHELKVVTIMADRLCELDGAGSAELYDPVWVDTRAATLARDVVERAKTTTLEKLDEEPQAFAIATRWLRSKLLPQDATPEGSEAATPSTL